MPKEMRQRFEKIQRYQPHPSGKTVLQQRRAEAERYRKAFEENSRIQRTSRDSSLQNKTTKIQTGIESTKPMDQQNSSTPPDTSNEYRLYEFNHALKIRINTDKQEVVLIKNEKEYSMYAIDSDDASTYWTTTDGTTTIRTSEHEVEMIFSSELHRKGNSGLQDDTNPDQNWNSVEPLNSPQQPQETYYSGHQQNIPDVHSHLQNSNTLPDIISSSTTISQRREINAQKESSLSLGEDLDMRLIKKTKPIGGLTLKQLIERKFTDENPGQDYSTWIKGKSDSERVKVYKKLRDKVLRENFGHGYEYFRLKYNKQQ